MYHNYGVSIKLEQEDAKLKKEMEELGNTKRSLVERTLMLEKLLAEGDEQQHLQHCYHQHKSRGRDVPNGEKEELVTVLLPPCLFVKTYALIRGSSKPLLLRVRAGEAVNIDKTNVPS